MRYSDVNKLISAAMLNEEITIKHKSSEDNFTDIIQCSYNIIFYIPSDNFVFDINKAKMVSPFFETELEVEIKDLMRAEITNQIFIYDETEYHKFLTDKFEVLVERKTLNYFGKKCKFRVRKDKSEIFVFEDEILVARIKTMQKAETLQ